jgi:hypothetical protein
MNPQGQPPDYISIPEHLRTRQASAVVGSRAVYRLFQQANIRRLGDLNGKRLSDFSQHPAGNNAILRQLRWGLLRVLHPGAEPDSTTWPILMRDYRPPGPALDVSPAIHSFRPEDLPISVRLGHVLEALGIERLGQLHGLPVRDVLRARNCGRHTLEELKTVLRRAEAGEFGLPEEGRPSRTATDLHPPDYISIPEHERATPVRSQGLPERLGELLRRAGICALGDLDGKRLSDFEDYHRWPRQALWELRQVILAAIHPDLPPDRRTRPIPIHHWWPRERAIEVSPTARDLRLQDLPVSARLEGVLQSLGIESLGQLHSLPQGKLWVRANCGQKTLAELRILLRRAEAGEFTLSPEQVTSSTPADLISLIDQIVHRLPERERAFLMLRFGASGQAPLLLRQLGQQYRVTGSAAGCRIACALAWMLRDGSLKLRELLARVPRTCGSTGSRLSPALVELWQDPARPFKHSPEFYSRLIPRLWFAAGSATAKRSTPG